VTFFAPYVIKKNNNSLSADLKQKNQFKITVLKVILKEKHTLFYLLIVAALILFHLKMILFIMMNTPIY